METYVSGNPKLIHNPPPVKVHATICSELTKLLDKIASILPALESARPGSTQGLKTLCSINLTIEKGKLVIRHCAESSKLYLALTGEKVLARCERLRSSVTENLSLIQSMVPMVLADQVTELIDYLNNMKFAMDPREEAAGKAISQLLHQIEDSTDEIRLKTLQKAASNLNLTSHKSLLIEKRSIRKLVEKVSGSNPEKEHALKFLYDLMEKHAKNIKPLDVKIEQNQSDFEPDDVSYHPVSNLKTVCVSPLEGKDDINENPVTKASKEQNEARLQVLFPWKEGYFSEFSPGKFLNFFKDLGGLDREKRKKAVEDVVALLERDVDTCYLMLSNGFGEALIEFLRMSYQLSDTGAQEVGAQLFLAYIRNNRVNPHVPISAVQAHIGTCLINSALDKLLVQTDYTEPWVPVPIKMVQSEMNLYQVEFPTFTEEILRIVTPFLDVETNEALVVIQKFSQYLTSIPDSPSKKLSSDDINILEICMEIVCDLSSQDKTKSQMFSSGYLKALASILSYEKLAMCSLKVLQIYSFSEEGAQLIGRNPKFISCLVELLETSTSDEKEVALSILYFICSLWHENCFVVREQFVVPSLVDLSVNGSEMAIEMSMKLLQILRDLRDDDSEMGMGIGTVNTCSNEQFVSKTAPILPKKKGVFSRFRSLVNF